MAEVKDKLITAGGLKLAYDSLKGQANLSSVIGAYMCARRDGKVYSTNFSKFSDDPTASGTKANANANLVCEPSTDTVEGHDDYENIPLFQWVRCNYVREADGFAIPTALEGQEGYKTDGNVDVGCLYMTFYFKQDENGSVHITDSPKEGFEPWYEAVRADGTVMPYFIYSAYWSVKGDDNNLHSQPGKAIETFQSHDNMRVNYQKKGAGYWGAGASRNAFGWLMTAIKYGTKSVQKKFAGCTNHNFQYSAAVASSENGTYFPLTAAQAANVEVGLNVAVGSYGANSGTDRGLAAIRERAGVCKVLRKENLSDGNVAVYVETTKQFNTAPNASGAAALLSSWPCNSGLTDAVVGHHDGSPVSNTSDKYPCRIQGLEFLCGADTVASDTVMDVQNDYSKDVYIAPRGVAHVSNIATIKSTYKLAGKILPVNGYNSFQVGDTLIKDGVLIRAGAASAGSETGCGDKVYFGGDSKSGQRELLEGGYFGDASNAGFCFLFCWGGLGSAYWHNASCD